MDWTRLFNYAIKLFIVCPSNCTSCAERSCAWVIIRLLVCHSNHHIFLHYSKKILVNIYSSCCNSGYIFARFIIPSDYLQAFSFISYIIVAAEIAFVGLELFLLYKIVRVLPKIIKNIKNIEENYSFSYAIDAAFDTTMKRGKLIDVILTECKLIYYAFLSWREKYQQVNLYTHIIKRLVL